MPHAHRHPGHAGPDGPSGAARTPRLRRSVAFPALCLLSLLLLCLGVRPALAAQATPGKDGAGGTLSGVVNGYWPGTANAGAGSTNIALGTRAGAPVNITAGDLLVVIQMQGADIDTSNTGAYGDGVAGEPGRGFLAGSLRAGAHEYVVAQNTVGAGGGTLQIQGTGGGGGLVGSYANAASGAQGRRSFQVIRVPQYTTAAFSSGLTALAWNGTTGGVLAVDVQDTLTLGGNVDLTGLGFRGAGSQQRGTTSGNNLLEYVTLSTGNRNAGKGEGIAGTPRHVYRPATGLVDTGTEGWAAGSFGVGAPGNAGGGGTDRTGTNHNAGGGGGSNAGVGGRGGFSWNSANTDGSPLGGFGGAPLPVVVDRAFLGGGGGAGSRNDSGGPNGSGGAGGGLALVRTGFLAGSGTITVDGARGLDSANEAGGGGGGAGSVHFVTYRSPSLSGLSVVARGGRGGDAWPTQGTPVSNAHGPGAGGGGGTLVANRSGASTNLAGGPNGTTLTVQLQYGAQPGGPGSVIIADEAGVPGVSGGGLPVTDLSTSTKTVVDPNGGDVEPQDVLRFTVTIRETGGVAAGGISVSDDLPSNLGNLVVESAPAGATVTEDPNGGANGTGAFTVTGISIAANGTESIVFTAQVDGGADDGDPIDNSATISLDGNDLVVSSPTLIVNENSVPASGNKPLYLSELGDPGDLGELTRSLPPVSNPGDGLRLDGDDESASWALTPTLAAPLTLAAGTFPVRLFLTRQGGQDFRSVEVRLSTVSNPGTFISDTFAGNLGNDDDAPDLIEFDLDLTGAVTVPAGEALLLTVINTTGRSNRRIEVYAQSADFAANDLAGRSQVVLPALTVINVDSVEGFDAPFPNGTAGEVRRPSETIHVRAAVSDPFGVDDIAGAVVEILDPNGNVFQSTTPMTRVGDDGAAVAFFEFTRTTTSSDPTGVYTMRVTAEEGIENEIFHTGVGTFELGLPDFVVLKSSTVLSDLTNGTDNPKRIPGATLRYDVDVTNQGRGRPDPDSVVITDALPANVELGVGSPPVTFSESPPGETGLSLDPSGISYSVAPNGGPPFTGTPVDADGDGFYDNVTGMRIVLDGEMAGRPTTGDAPAFRLSFTVRLL